MLSVTTVSNLPSDINNGAANAINAQKRVNPAALNLFSSNSIKECARSPLPFLMKTEKTQRSSTSDKGSSAGSLPSSPYLKNETRLANSVVSSATVIIVITVI